MRLDGPLQQLQLTTNSVYNGKKYILFLPFLPDALRRQYHTPNEIADKSRATHTIAMPAIAPLPNLVFEEDVSSALCGFAGGIEEISINLMEVPEIIPVVLDALAEAPLSTLCDIR